MEGFFQNPNENLALKSTQTRDQIIMRKSSFYDIYGKKVLARGMTTGIEEEHCALEEKTLHFIVLPDLGRCSFSLIISNFNWVDAHLFSRRNVMAKNVVWTYLNVYRNWDGGNNSV